MSCPVPVTLILILAFGVLCGAVNGVLIGYLRLRAFLTTLVTLIIFRSIYEIVFLRMSTSIMSGFSDSDLWLFIGEGTVCGVPVSLLITLAIALAWHIVLSRMRPGWRLTAVGGARRSAYNAGIDVRRIVFLTYVASGTMCALAGFLFAARIGSTGSDTGVGLEVQALTAAVLGGNSIGGGRGSVAKAIIGALLVLMLTNGLINLGISGPVTSTILGAVLLLAVFVDMRWQKHRHRLLAKIYVSPAYLQLPEPRRASTAPGSPYALNDRLRSVEIIGLGQIEGPEDVILDRDDNLYCGTRHGDIVRFFGPDHKRSEIFAHIGGHPLGMAFDRAGNLLVCIGGMGLFQVAPDKTVTKLTDETNRSLFSVIDDSRLRLADDVDVAPDGRIYFSEATIRYEQEDWATDALESRGERPHHLLRSQDRQDAYRDSEARLRQWRRHVLRRAVLHVRGELDLLDQPLLVRRPEEGHQGTGHRQSSRLSRQHQPRVRRQLLAGAASACAGRRSIWQCRCPASASAWRAASRPISGSIRTSTRAAW